MNKLNSKKKNTRSEEKLVEKFNPMGAHQFRKSSAMCNRDLPYTNFKKYVQILYFCLEKMAISVGLKIISILELVLVWGILLPFCLLSIVKYYSVREAACIRCREPLGAVAIIICVFLNVSLLTLRIPISLLVFGTLLEDSNNIPLSQAFGAASIIVSNATCQIFLLRCFTIVFKMNYHMHTFQNQWKQLVVGSENVNANKSWYLRHYDKLSSTSWLLGRVFIPGLLFVCVVSFGLLTVFGSLAVILYQMIFIFLYIMLGVIIIQKLPKYRDFFGVKDEIIMTIWLGITFFVCTVTAWSIFFVHRDSAKIVFLILLPVASFCIMMFVFSSIHRILQKNATHIPKRVGLLRALWCDKMSVSRSHLSVISDSGPQRHVDLHVLLGDPNLFDLFMEHVFSEFSSENLLCYLELCQYRQEIKKQCERENITIDDAHPNKFILSEVLPKSKIKSSFFLQFSPSLYPFIFDPILKELLLLMRDSFSRFAQTAPFQKWNSKYNQP
ncbi:hypothetical protein RFI_18506 [Reticulomyxa filosa]|uniref:RGS domain-containing protein n=1 Tax=Reticulomyxa filosa TaxID=46433 RepID=X6MXJ8_RETFI|nr:hypothetical protein RFI_18506 [Reticulomyxa filosa]|eukprot:ETO18750.1 hypothetical protein RFI_18506 [Reticulomyxa filosa]